MRAGAHRFCARRCAFGNQKDEAVYVDEIFADVSLPAANEIKLRIRRDVNPRKRGEGVDIEPSGGEEREIDQTVTESFAQTASVRLQS